MRSSSPRGFFSHSTETLLGGLRNVQAEAGDDVVVVGEKAATHRGAVAGSVCR